MTGLNNRTVASERRWLGAARWAWILVALLAIGILIASTPAYLQPLTTDLPSGIPVEKLDALGMTGVALGRLISFASAALSLLLAGLLYWRRTDDRMALLVSYFLLIYGVTLTGPGERLEMTLTGKTDVSIFAATFLLTVPTVVIFSLFPSGTFVPRWTRWLSLGSVVWLPLYLTVSPGTPTSNTLSATYAIGLVWILAIVVPMLYAQIYRYRHVSNQAERQQTKWVLYGFGLWLALTLLSSVPYAQQLSQQPGAATPSSAVGLGFIWWITQAILPVSLAIALLRYRLWEIDLIINRSLVYGVLSLVLALVYLLSVLALQVLFRELTGHASPLAVVASTLVIAAMFNPLRQRIQTAIDRRLYRRKYDAAHTLDALGRRLQEQVDLGELSGSLMEIVEQSVQPERVALWLKE